MDNPKSVEIMNMEITNNLKVDKEVMKNSKNVEISGVFEFRDKRKYII